MFVAGKLFESAEEAKKWVEGQTTPDERRHWIVLMLDSFDAAPPQPPSVLSGLNDGSIKTGGKS